MSIYVIRAFMKIHPNTESYGKFSKKILLEKRRKRRKKMVKEKENDPFLIYLLISSDI